MEPTSVNDPVCQERHPRPVITTSTFRSIQPWGVHASTASLTLMTVTYLSVSPGDGVPVPFMAINRQLPAPPINVCEGDEIVVDLTNALLSDTETLHWHGLHQKNSKFMDGVPFITQCPILGKFRYQFPADRPGTYFYHSHSGTHRLAGVQGALVIREVEDPQIATYDHDLFPHTFLLQDWSHVSSGTKFIGKLHYISDDFVSSFLVNGIGINTMAESEGITALALDHDVVEVSPDQRYRLRFINGAALNCPILMSIDDHNFTVITTDGNPVKPTTVNSLLMFPGERFDVVVEANQQVDNYWIRLNGLIDCGPNECYQGIVLHYSGAEGYHPHQHLQYDPEPPKGTYMNPLNSGSGDLVVTMADLEGFSDDTDPCLQPEVDKQFYLGFDFGKINNTFLFNPDYYPYDAVSEEWQMNTPQFNDLTFLFPSSPPLSQGMTATEGEYCRYGEEAPCDGDFCSCTYILEIELGETVEIVLVDQGHVGNENHPFHLHGYAFHVVAMDRLGSETTVEEVKALDAEGGINRKLDHTVQKDDVTVPDGGYTIIRFTADNPGYWFLHCHIMFHSEMGMAAILKVGSDADIPSPPEGFPKCGNYMPPIH